MNTLPRPEEAIEAVRKHARDFCVRSVGCMVEGMDTDCYMNVHNWANSHMAKIKSDPDLYGIFDRIGKEWNWEKDSANEQSEQVKCDLSELHARLVSQ